MMAGEEKWCPLGRISIQHWDNGVFREGVPGAYNLVLRVDAARGEAGSYPIAATPCMGGACRFYRRGMVRWSSGSCKLEQQANIGPWVFVALVIVEMMVIATKLFLK